MAKLSETAGIDYDYDHDHDHDHDMELYERTNRP